MSPLKPPEPVNRALLRQLLWVLCPTDSDLDAFCIDYLPGVQERFTNGMDRVNKVNLLLQSTRRAVVHAFLIQRFGMVRIEEARRSIGPTVDARHGSDVDMVGDEITRIYRLRAPLRASGQPTSELDDELRRLKQIQRQRPQLQEGELLADRYQLVGIIGRGGFGKVWQAHDLERDQQLVAIKVLHSEQADDPSRVTRFARGAKQVAALTHAHLVRILEGPTQEHGFHYFVMEYLPGGDLHDAVIKQRISREQALRAVLQVGAALQYAHTLGLIHRDVKPQNILIDHTGDARLTDFDLVLAADSTGGTGTGAMLGTYFYAAHEALEDGATVDVRADIYSLAMTTLFVFYGKPLPVRAILHRNEFIDDLDCSEPVRALLRSATADNPAERPARVADFCDQLAHVLGPILLYVPPARQAVPSPAPHAQVPSMQALPAAIEPIAPRPPFFTRWRRPYLTTGVLLVAGLIAVATYLWTHAEPKSLDSLPELQPEVANQAFYQRFVRVAKADDYQTAIVLYRQLSGSSPFKQAAYANYSQTFLRFFADRIKHAAAARARNDCPAVGAALKEILDIDPSHRPALDARAQPCGARPP